jgi:hypothetical protein
MIYVYERLDLVEYTPEIYFKLYCILSVVSLTSAMKMALFWPFIFKKEI